MTGVLDIVEQDMFGVDIHDDGDGDVVLGPDGDWQIAVGRECLFQWCNRAIKAQRGDDLVDTDWGRIGDSPTNAPSSPVLHSSLAASIRQVLLTDDRVVKCRLDYLQISQGAGVFYNITLETPVGQLGLVSQ